ncbi:MAG: hypothetical protein M3O70_18290, partial [Actinomycetota bacterium]|nr:hypothetical protein [Actinomycetota bacterium]
MTWRWIVEAQVSAADPNAWVNITRYVTALALPRGRSDDLQSVETSTLTVELLNTDGRFSPENTLGAYYPRIVPNRGVRAKVDVNGTVTNRFTGHAVEWDPNWQVGKAGRVRLTAHDFFEKAAQVDTAGYAAATVLQRMAPDGYWPLHDPEHLPDLSGNAVTATLDETEGEVTRGDPIGYTTAADAGLPAYWGPSLIMGRNAREYNQARVPDHPRYGTPNNPFSVHFRMRLDADAAASERNLLGAGLGGPQASLTQRFVQQRWAIYLNSTETLQYARGHPDGTQGNWGAGQVVLPDVGYSFIFCITPAGWKLYTNGVLVFEDTPDLTIKRPDIGLLWMGGLQSAQGIPALIGLKGRISDVAIWGDRDIST